jgi:cobalt/nickel transport system permease protein
MRFQAMGFRALTTTAIPAVLLFIAAFPRPASAMHISEGILPLGWAGLWFAVSLPFLAWGLRELKRRASEDRHLKPLVGLVGAAVFIISCLPIPVPTAGTCSHMCGTGLAAILIGPSLTVVITSVALVLQALFLAHGGLTTLGADIVSMGVAGAFSGYAVYRLSGSLGAPEFVSTFMAGLMADWCTYAATSFELATALSSPGAMTPMFAAIFFAFLPTQLPLGIFEGLISAGAFRFVRTRRPDLLAGIKKP